MRLILIISFIFLAQLPCLADDDIVIVSASQKNTKQGSESFSDKIRSIRMADGEMEVFFEKKGGPYSIKADQDNTGTLQQACNAAYSKKITLSVSVDKDNDVLLSAEVDAMALATSSSEAKTAPVDPEKKKQELNSVVDSEIDKALKGLKGK